MARACPRYPLVAVVGATGTGKSQLAVELAKQYNGEVINGDAMQLYAGLPIITNKISTGEQQGIPHHLLGCIGLHEQTWVVGSFVRNALKIIEEIRSRGRLPILVGGTHYYTQSLLFHEQLSEDKEGERSECVDDVEEKWPILQESTEILLRELKKIDPVMADRWHPNDRRKIQRSLAIYFQTGKRASDIYSEQRARKRENGLAEHPVSGMRFPTLLFWVHAENDALRERLDKRVDKMIDRGLLDEVETLRTFADDQAVQGLQVDETRGIWVSIGYKEFKEYAQAAKSGGANNDLNRLFTTAKERTQIATRQYSKRQLKWIRMKLAAALEDSNADRCLYLLDGSDVSKYDSTVVAPALDMTGKFLHAEDMPTPVSLSSVAAEILTRKQEHRPSAAPEDWSKQHCPLCNVTCVMPEQWQRHIRSKAHRKLTAKAKHAEGFLDPGS